MTIKKTANTYNIKLPIEVLNNPKNWDIYNLPNMVGSYIGASQPTQNTSAVILSASQTMGASYNVSTAGLFVSWQTTGAGQYTFMFWALNFTTINAYAGYTITVAFKLIT